MKRKIFLSYSLFLCLFLVVNTHATQFHNTFLGVAPVSIGHIAITNPIVAIVGATAVLATVAYDAYQSYEQRYSETELPTTIPDKILLADRFYYLSRKNSLEKLMHELLVIKSEVEKIHGLCNGSFTCQLLQQHNYRSIKNVWLPSIEYERKLSDEKKAHLRKERENELGLLEERIQEVHLLLALHVNQLINNIIIFEEMGNDIGSEFDAVIDDWNNNVDNITDAIALKAYTYNVLQEEWIKLTRQSLDELLFVMTYYRSCTSLCIKKSTSIGSVVENLFSEIHEKRKRINELKHMVEDNNAMVEHYFAERKSILVAFRREASNDFAKRKKQKEAQILKDVESKLSEGNPSGGPKKDDDEDEEEGNAKIEIYEKNVAHIFRDEPGHFIHDTPANRKILIDVASNVKNFLGKCGYGNEWYAKILNSGQQVWVSVRNGLIRNGGINELPFNFNSEIGLCRFIK